MVLPFLLISGTMSRGITNSRNFNASIRVKKIDCTPVVY
ncbi:hypothetical protein SAMN06295960_4224 [Paenibacillus aquistagni]|uniref:Uncharacterized protein n=1 Tax=Paenibacillus aquistagni TaxID=1852522 RepID=A0A1X7LTV4_9BACL|nr:hypothetical protein SAMN06295960_4224 [Paenibacillus aquistagni]